MAGITSTNVNSLPNAQTLFTNGSVQESPSSEFTSSNPTSLDQPHPQYLGLIKSHVAVLQAIGTPEAFIAQISSARPQAEYLDRYIQDQIMQNPEGWDEYVGNPVGTARAGLQQLLPGVQFPSASTTVGSSPFVDATADKTAAVSESEGLLKGLVFAGAAVGLGVLGWKVLKGKQAGSIKAAEDSVRNLIGQGTRVDYLANLSSLPLQTVVGGGGGALSGVAGTASSVSLAATLESISRGHGAANGFLNSVGSSAIALNMPMSSAVEAALADRAMGVLEQLAHNGGTVADLATARVLTTQLGTAASAAGSELPSLQQLLAGVAKLAV